MDDTLEETFEPLNCFVGEVFPLVGSKLEKDVGFEYSLWLSRLSGRVGDGTAELRSEGAPGRQNCVIPSVGYGLCGICGMSA